MYRVTVNVSRRKQLFRDDAAITGALRVSRRSVVENLKAELLKARARNWEEKLEICDSSRIIRVSPISKNCFLALTRAGSCSLAPASVSVRACAQADGKTRISTDESLSLSLLRRYIRR